MVNPDKFTNWESAKGSYNWVGINFVDGIYPTEGSNFVFVFKSKSLNYVSKFKFKQLNRKLQAI